MLRSIASRPSNNIRSRAVSAVVANGRKTASTRSSLPCARSISTSPTSFTPTISVTSRTRASLVSFINTHHAFQSQRRYAGQLAPKRTAHRKHHKGRISVPTGGSTKGTTVVFGDYGLRLKEGTRLTAKQLSSADAAIRRKIKVVKGARVWMRVFPDIPVCTKGNETRMGKGKGTFEYWAARVPIGRVVFEIGGGGIRPEVAKEALRLASVKFPVKTEFVTRDAPPKLGSTHIPEILGDAPVSQAILDEGIAKSTASTL